MIISRTPYRISFFGGGTDYPVWYKENGGAVLGTTINKYCYIFLRELPPFFEHKHRIVWSKIEQVQKFSEIEHPSVRAILQEMKINHGLEIHHEGDLPARSGLGSSSSFTVGMLNAIHAMRGSMPTKLQLANQAIHIEREILKENVGSQDQVLAAFGGLNKVTFKGEKKIDIQPVIMNPNKLNSLQNHLMLFFTGLTRTASDIARSQIKNTPSKRKELFLMGQMVDTSIDILTHKRDLKEFGELLHDGWLLKRSLSDRISNQQIDDIYDLARKSGAIGGKLLGAGGGGFILLFVKPDNQPKVKRKLKKLLQVPFKFEDQGSKIVFYDK